MKISENNCNNDNNKNKDNNNKENKNVPLDKYKRNNTNSRVKHRIKKI